MGKFKSTLNYDQPARELDAHAWDAVTIALLLGITATLSYFVAVIIGGVTHGSSSYSGTIIAGGLGVCSIACSVIGMVFAVIALRRPSSNHRRGWLAVVLNLLPTAVFAIALVASLF